MAKILIAGALGVVGRAVVERLVGREGVEVVALSRRAPDFAPQATWLACDLRDPAATAAALAAHRDTTHIVYAAVSEQPDLLHGWREAGFDGCIDTEDCIVEHLRAMQDLRYLPQL